MKTVRFARRGVLRQIAGVTLVEVLFAIFIAGVGLLALLTLFPIGILELARAIQDDRADMLAIDAGALSEAGADLLSRTEEFIAASLAAGSADAKRAAGLRAEFEQLGLQAADIEAQLVELDPLVRKRKLRRRYLLSLSQIDAIQFGIGEMTDLLKLLEQPNLPP